MARTYRGSGRRSRRSGPEGKSRGDSFASVKGDAVLVNGYSASWLEKGFPWVWKEEIERTTGRFSKGQAVNIFSGDGRCLGTGIWDDGKLSVRRFRADEGPIDGALLKERIQIALQRRSLGKETNAWRWVHAENDHLPGIRIDMWANVATITLDSESLECLVPGIVDAVTTLTDVRAIWRGWRAVEGEKNSDPDLVWGVDDGSPLEVCEDGLRFLVQPGWGANAGLYPDMRQVRSWLADHWSGKRVLNLFAYTGAFSVAAGVNGASEVITVDLGQPAIQRAEANLVLNGLNPSAHPLIVEDAFKALDRFRRKNEHFDVVVADPPSFSHSDGSTWKSSADLSRLVAGCLRVLKPDGWLVVASNQGSVSPREFQKLVMAGGSRAGRSLRIIHQGTPPHDFPAALSFPEARYLKVWVLQG